MSIIKGTNQIVAGFGGTKRSIGEVYFSQSSLATDNPGALPLFTGETIASANTIYPEFYNWVLSHTELQCTSTEYETALSTYGECAKYVIGSGSLRLPLIKNYIKAANPSEGIKNIEAGLPDHNHTVSGSSNWGSLSQTGNEVALVTQVTTSNASASNPIYGKSSTVTPASTTLYPWVVAYTSAIPASTAQAAEFQQGLSGKTDTSLANVSANGIATAVSWGMPDFSSIISKSQSSESSPNITRTDCLVVFSGSSSENNGSGATLVVNMNGQWRTISGASGVGLNTLEVKGNAYLPQNTKYYVNAANFIYCYEIPLKGVN